MLSLWWGESKGWYYRSQDTVPRAVKETDAGPGGPPGDTGGTNGQGD